MVNPVSIFTYMYHTAFFPQISTDLGRMYTLVSRLAEDQGRDELQTRFEAHVYSQGVAGIEKCGESAQNVSGLLRINRFVALAQPLANSSEI